MSDIISRKDRVKALIEEREKHPALVNGKEQRFNQAVRGGIRKALREIETAPAIDNGTLVRELIRRGIAKVTISLPPYHTADVHFSGPITILQLQGDWSDKL